MYSFSPYLHPSSHLFKSKITLYKSLWTTQIQDLRLWINISYNFTSFTPDLASAVLPHHYPLLKRRSCWTENLTTHDTPYIWDIVMSSSGECNSLLMIMLDCFECAIVPYEPPPLSAHTVQWCSGVSLCFWDGTVQFKQSLVTPLRLHSRVIIFQCIKPSVTFEAAFRRHRDASIAFYLCLQ